MFRLSNNYYKFKNYHQHHCMSFYHITRQIDELLHKTCNHKFNQLLFSGNLPQQRYQLYLSAVQNYLDSFREILNETAKKHHQQNKPAAAKFFSEQSLSVVEFKKSMKVNGLPQNTCTPQLKVDRNFSSFVEMKHHRHEHRVIHDYLLHLKTVNKYGTLAQSIAGVTPFFWLYYQLGLVMDKSIQIHHPYYAWLSTYNSQNYQNTTLKLIDIFNKELIDIPKNSSHAFAVLESFRTSLQFEHDFFEAIYPSEYLRSSLQSFNLSCFRSC